MLACDLVVAGTGARFGVPEVKRGLVAAAGAAMLLPERVPPPWRWSSCSPASRSAPTARTSSAWSTGWSTTVRALDAALELAATIAANGPLAVAVTKQIARSARDWTTEEGWREQDELIGPVFASEDAIEGATAFAEKRPPVWKGR